MNMALREEAVRMMDALPDDGIRATILYMSEYRRKQEEEKRLFFPVRHSTSIFSTTSLMENMECGIRWLEVLNSKKDSISTS